ncbi:hypothetical protein [Actinoplanes sp. NPDC051411]|uniref:hypothetical protein n=1 Tax=unclassified Actinoplanes TaxID=2626549 RepID=UPI00343E442B
MSSLESAAPSSATGRRPHWWWTIPATTFLLGILLGAGLMTIAGYGPETAGRGAATADPTPSSPAQRVVLPASCRQALEQAKTAVSTAQEAVDAVRHLQTGRLQRLLDELEKARRQLDATTDRCHQATAAVG